MKKVFEEKFMYWAIVAEFDVNSITPLKMVDPITARILNIEGKAILYYIIIHLACKCSW
jgi:hypothetical protein